MPEQKELLQEFQKFSLSDPTAESLMQHVSDRLHQEKSRFNWIGFYLIAKDDPNVLEVGPYTGSFTPHTRIPLHEGLCGAAASTGKPVVVNDVSKDPRYFAGTDLVKSEMVVPFFAGKRVVGELDINSYFLGTFTPQEQEFVEACATLVGRYFEKHPR